MEILSWTNAIIWINIEKVKMLKLWKVFNNNNKTDDGEKGNVTD